MSHQHLILRSGRYTVEVRSTCRRDDRRTYVVLVRYQHADGRTDRLRVLPWMIHPEVQAPAALHFLDRRRAWEAALETTWKLAEHQERCHG